MASPPKSPNQGHPSPALSQTLGSSTHSTKAIPQNLSSQKQPPGPCTPKSRFSPIKTASTGPHVTNPSHATVLPSPTPSEETRSTPATPSQPSSGGPKATAPENSQVSPWTAKSSPASQVNSFTQPTIPAQAFPVAGAAGPENANSSEPTAASQGRCEEWLAEVESYISHQTGSLQPLEKLRLQFIKAVLSVGDEFCVIVHGFVVLWVLDPQRCAELLGLSRAVVDAACGTLDIVFRGTRTMRNDVLAWMVDFPPGLRSGNLSSTSVMGVSRFFQRLARSWNDLLRDHLCKRQIPLRHRELVGVLQLRSQNLRHTFFRWSLTFLKVWDVPDNAEIMAVLERKFGEDQDFYLDHSRSKEEYESHDSKLSSAFELLMSAARRGLPEGAPPRGGHVAQAPVQGQQLRSPQQHHQQQPQNQPKEQPRKRRRTQSLDEHEQEIMRVQEYQKQQHQLQRQWHHLHPHQQQQQYQHQQPEHLQNLQQQHQSQHPPSPQRQQRPPRPQGRGHIQLSPSESQGLTESQRRDLERQALLQRSIMHHMQLAQHNHQMAHQQQQQQQRVHAPGHQPEQSQHSYPTHFGTWPPSPTDAVPSPVQGQMSMSQEANPMPGCGRQPQIQGSTPVTLSTGPGTAIYQGVPILAQMSQHGRGRPISNPVTPTMNSPVSRRPSIEQQPRIAASHNHIQVHPGSAMPPRQPMPGHHQQGNYVNTRFVPCSQYIATPQDVSCEPTPARDPPSPPPSDQLHVPQEPFHQYLDSLLAGPTRLPTNAKRVKFEFDISETDFKRLSQITTSGDGKSVFRSIFEGSRRVRFRICTKPVPKSAEGSAFQENEWVDATTVWPSSLSVKVNENGYVDIPKMRGGGGELPCEIAGFLRAGRNMVSVAVASEAPPGHEFFGAVEMLDTATPSSIIESAIRKRSLSEAETIGLIKTRLTTQDDDAQVVDTEISISVADPISRSLVGLPCRGDTCSHLDVFDLRALLESRRPKWCPHGGSRTSCPACVASLRAWRDIAPADAWACPICGGDARPGHLVVDKFLQGVVWKLGVDSGKEGGYAPAVYVDREGRWRAKSPEMEKERRGR